MAAAASTRWITPAIPVRLSGNLPGIVSLYHGEGDANDAVGGNNGTLVNGVAFAPGQLGQAFSFDGVDDYVDLGNNPSLNLPGDLTVGAWVNSQEATAYLISDFDVTGKVSQGSLGIQDNHFFWYQSMTDGSALTVTGAATITAGQWYHVAAVRDDVAKAVTLYVNGAVDGSSSYAGTVVDLQQTKVLGTSEPVGFPNDFLNGQIDEPSFYNRPLTAEEIRRLANSTDGAVNGIQVNLPLGTASGLLGGIQKIQNVIGSAGRPAAGGCDRVRAGQRGVLVGEPAVARRDFLCEHLRRVLRRQLGVEQRQHDLLADQAAELVEHHVTFGRVLDERVLLGHRAEMDSLAHVLHVLEVLAPAGVDDLEDHEALELAHRLRAELLLLRLVLLLRILGELLDERLAGERDLLAHLVGGDLGAVERPHRLDERVEIPLLAPYCSSVYSCTSRSITSSIQPRTSSERSSPSSTERRCS